MSGYKEVLYKVNTLGGRYVLEAYDWYVKKDF